MKRFYALLGSLLLLSASAFGSAIPDFPFVLVKGYAEKQVTPDVAIIRVSVLEYNKSSNEAVAAVLQRGKDIMRIAEEAGVAKEFVTALSYQVQIKRATDAKYQSTDILGYDVTQDFTIELKGLAKYTALVDKISSLPNIQRLTPSFYASNEDAIIVGLVKEACADAKQKASNLASGLGVELGTVFAVTQDSAFSSFSAVFGHSEESSVMYKKVAGMPSINNMYPPKYIDINKTVQVVYKIKP